MGINVSRVTCSVRIASKSRQSDSYFVPQCTQCSSLSLSPFSCVGLVMRASAHVTCSVRIASKPRESDSFFVPMCTQCKKFVTVTILTCWSRDACISILHMYVPHLRATGSVHNSYKHQGISGEPGNTRTTFDIEYPLTSSRHSSRY